MRALRLPRCAGFISTSAYLWFNAHHSRRPAITAHSTSVKIPMVIEIPSKDSPAGSAEGDPLMKRIMQLLGES